MADFIVFETPRLILRRMTEADAPLIFALNSSPDVLRYLHEPELKDEADARRVIMDIIMPQYSLYNLGRWAMILKEGNTFIGWCGLKFRPELEETDLGYRLMPQYWGHGYATEAAAHTLYYGLDILKLEIITGRAHIENTASWTVLEKIGMQYIKDEIVDDCPVKTYTISKSKAEKIVKAKKIFAKHFVYQKNSLLLNY
jgi:[ribosomal protein S5]-alanine N-acetyltransferase